MLTVEERRPTTAALKSAKLKIIGNFEQNRDIHTLNLVVLL